MFGAESTHTRRTADATALAANRDVAYPPELVDVRRAARDVGLPLSKSAYSAWAADRAATPVSKLMRAYSSWAAISERAGLPRPRGRPTAIERAQALAALEAAKRELGPTFGQSEFARWRAQANSPVSLAVLRRIFGCFAIAAAEVGVVPRRPRRINLDAATRAQVQAVCDGTPLSSEDFNRRRPLGVPSARRIARQHPGGWTGLLREIGLTPRPEQVAASHRSPRR